MLCLKNIKLFNKYAQDILSHELFLQSKQIFSHGTISIYEHSINVACFAFSIAENYSSFDIRCVVRAALLHDFFLYEWHIPGWRYIMHRWKHPVIAAKKAREVFNINEKEYSCIETHMWPWTFWSPPRCREGWLISLADKIIAFKETALWRGKRNSLQALSVAI